MRIFFIQPLLRYITKEFKQLILKPDSIFQTTKYIQQSFCQNYIDMRQVTRNTADITEYSLNKSWLESV